jgi:hypothetical protein
LNEETGFITSQDPSQAVYHPMSDVWLISWTTPSGLGTGVVYSLWRPDLAGRLVADQKVEMSPANFNSRSQACPVNVSQVAADLRFEELPSPLGNPPIFADSSGQGHQATCSGDACPVLALPGAVDHLGNPVSGGPQGKASDYAIRFEGLGDTISLPNPVGQTFTVAFWYKANASSLPWPFTINGGANGFALKVYPNTPLIEFLSGSATLTATPNVNDGRWHFIAATREANGRLALYLDGNATEIAALSNAAVPNLPATLQISGGGTAVDLDQLQLFPTALRGSTLRELYARSLQAYCVGVNYMVIEGVGGCEGNKKP